MMVTSEGYERSELWLRAKRVMVVFNDTPMEEGSGVFFLTAHFVIPVISLLWRKVLECSSSHCSLRYPCDLTLMEEVSGVFFLTLLTSSSLCSHSYGGRFWSVLPHPAHFVIPVFSLLWRKVLECSSSHCSLRHPCDLTLMEEGSGVFFLTAHFVIPVSSLTSSSLCSHTYDLSSHPSHRYP